MDVDDESELGSWDFGLVSDASDDESEGCEDEISGEEMDSDSDADSEYCPQDSDDDGTDRENGLETVSVAIKNVEPPGSYCCSGSRSSFPLPLLRVRHVQEEIALPVRDDLAQMLQQGSMHKPLKFPGEDIYSENTAWLAFVDELVSSVQMQLGIPSDFTVIAKLAGLQLLEANDQPTVIHEGEQLRTKRIGKLLLVLPSHVNGGDFSVRTPSGVSTLNLDAMDPYTVKYVAFYSDCDCQAMPITSGVSLCLMYNLRIDDGRMEDIDDETNGSMDVAIDRNGTAYRQLKEAVSEFFSLKSDIAFDIADPETHRETKLVHMLEHKYSRSQLSTRYLRRRDLAVAWSLQKFCEESGGAFRLLLATARYRITWMYEVECGDNYHAPKNVELVAPWVHWGESAAEKDVISGGNLRCCVASEVLPWEALLKAMKDHVDIEKDEAFESRIERDWYTKTALVLLPVYQYLEWQAGSQSETLLQCWLRLIDSNPRLGWCTARVFDSSHSVAMVAADAEKVFDSVRRVGCLKVYERILGVYCRWVRLPVLRSMLVDFESAQVVQALSAVVAQWRCNRNEAEKDGVQLLLSVLHSELCADTMKDIFNAIKPIATGSDVKTFAQVLQFAALASPDTLAQAINAATTGPSPTWMDPAMRSRFSVVVPAVLLLLQKLQGAMPETMRTTVRQFHRIAKQQLPMLRNAVYIENLLACPSIDESNYDRGLQSIQVCARCEQLRSFLNCSFQVELHVSSWTPDERTHLRQAIGGKWAKLLTITELDGTISVSKTHEAPEFAVAQEQIAQIQAMIESRAEDDAVNASFSSELGDEDDASEASQVKDRESRKRDDRDTDQVPYRFYRVYRALKRVEPRGEGVYTGSRGSFPLPRILVEEVGELRLPTSRVSVTSFQVKYSAQNGGYCSVGATRFTCGTASWDRFIASLVEEARVPLGIHSSIDYVATLDKLVLLHNSDSGTSYPTATSGGGHFGTLAVWLPSAGDSVMNTVPASMQSPGDRGDTISEMPVRFAAFYNGEAPVWHR